MATISENVETHVETEHSNQHEVSNKSIAVKTINDNNALQTINFLNDKEVLAAESFLRRLIKSGKSGITSVEDGFAVLMRAKDLNLPFSTCIEHIHVINGKTGVDVHVIKALLSRAGCTWECTKNYQPLYEYTDGFNVYVDGSFPDYVVRCDNRQHAMELAAKDSTYEKQYVYPVKWYKDFNGNVYKDYQLNTDKFGITINREQVAAIAAQKKIPVYRIPNQPVDYVTEYKIKRKINGEVITHIGRFSYNDALNAGLFEKDTYKKYPKVLVGHRAFTLAARECASDVLFGVMETTEIKIINGAELSPTDITSVEEVEVIE